MGSNSFYLPFKFTRIIVIAAFETGSLLAIGLNLYIKVVIVR